MFAFVGLNYGVDFKGGTNFVVRIQQPANLDELRAKLNGLGVGEVEIQEFGQPTDVLIKHRGQAGEEAQQAVSTRSRRRWDPNVEYLSVETSVAPRSRAN